MSAGKVLMGLVLMASVYNNSSAQETMSTIEKNKNNVFAPQRKGNVFASWGWNRSFYSNSTITLKGADYDIAFEKVKASDRPTLPITANDYLRIDHLTIPQTNFRVGYFIQDNFSLSIGVDHMKYVMKNNQTVKAKGTINREGKFQGSYDGPIILSEDLLTFEHTDGLNYINIEAEKYKPFYQNRKGSFFISGMLGASAGALMPKSNVRFLDYERSDRYHFAGFGLNVKGGVQFVVLKHLAIKFEQRFGYINMPDIALHQKGIEGKGKQSFFFGETVGLIGAVYKF